jgi:cell division protease FtsH
MALRYGMDDALGPVALADRSPRFLVPAGGPDTALPAVAISPMTAQRIDDAVRGLLDGAMARATALLGARRAALDRCAKALIEQETLDEAQLLDLIRSEPLAPEVSSARGSPAAECRVAAA